MKTIICFVLIISTVISCTSEENEKWDSYQFVKQYSAEVTVGGVVGIMERTFEIGEIYTGMDMGNDSINIRIEEHTKRNEDCPNSWCYQEFLEVPSEYLRLAE